MTRMHELPKSSTDREAIVGGRHISLFIVAMPVLFVSSQLLYNALVAMGHAASRTCMFPR